MSRKALNALKLAAVAAGAAAILAPHATDSQTCDHDAARNLLVSSYVDAQLNPPKQEDTEFFIRAGGVPNVMVLLDTSGSMERLPPDGPMSLGGASGATPPGVLVSDPLDPVQQDAAYNADPITRPVGCGIDPVTAANPAFVGNAMIQSLRARRFSPPCGNAVNPALVGAAYAGQSTDYAQQMTVCPYFTSSNNLATGAPGFDPDFYNASNPTATMNGARPSFFGRDLVFHDTVASGPTYDNGNQDFRHNFGNGWTDTAVYPARRGGNMATIGTFCAAQGTTLQGVLTREQICNQCLSQAGWYYDGVILDESDNGVVRRYPSVWYTGNYLNFFPPKFLMARKVLKDLIATQSRVRMAIAKFDVAGTGALVDQPFNPTCGMPDTSSFDSNRAAYVSAVDAITFSGGTPLSRALFDAGRYYHTPDLPWFGATWEAPTKESSANANQYAVCYSCQTSSVVLITDGAPAVDDGEGTHLPPGGLTATQLKGAVYAGSGSTGIQEIDSSVCPQCDTFSGAEDYKNNLARVAFYMHNMDLRRNDETTLDCKANGGKQSLDFYTLGFATSSLPTANQVLANAATAGGGIFVAAESSKALKDGLLSILEEINGRSTSFSVATISTLQTTSGRSVIVPRFDPSKSSAWRGHLFRYDLYSEFVNKCTPGGTGDLDCDDTCMGAFLQDKDGDFVSEDTSGVFRKNDPPNLPTCDAAPLCKKAGRACAVPGTAEAKEWWNAGETLATTAWRSRRVFSVVDDNGDGRIDAADETFELDTSNDLAAAKLLPYMALGGTRVCDELANRLSSVSAFAWGNLVRTNKIECAKMFVRYLKGADLFNEKRNSTYTSLIDPESLWDRSFKLGDIFHSSPVVVDPPFPPNGIMCKNGLTTQCLPSLWETTTKSDADGDGEPEADAETSAYARYASSTPYKDRRKIVVVGANDGLLHAFNAGTWRAKQDDPMTTALDESQPPFNGYYERGDLSGGAQELWAFLPPDLASKVPLLVSSEHHLFVDGSPMVRDVWVDGSSGALGGPRAKDDLKQQWEFHTVAVVAERRGGTHFFALDLTDATELTGTPKFLWIYPQPDDRETLAFGETYDGYLPKPPPIGPVRIQADARSGSPGKYTPVMEQGLDAPTSFHERWVVFLNGGFDPQYLRGRGVHMVDVWTGTELFDFSYPADPGSVDPSDPRLQLKFPVAATVGMVPWGQSVSREAREDNDYFFDTATFGDAGGQLWVLRFNTPGVLGTDGRATNWFGARVFQMGSSSSSCKFCGGQPFFYMTANFPITNGYYRVTAGTGDRFNLLDRAGGTCGPDNLRACALRGCTVTLELAENALGTVDLGYEARGLSEAACNPAAVSSAAGTVAACGAGGKVKIVISGCPAPVPTTGPTGTTKATSVACTPQADGHYACTTTTLDAGMKLVLSDTANAPSLGNWYYSLLVFEPSGARGIFKDLAGAKAYDAARLWLNQTGLGTHTSSSNIVTLRATDDAPTTKATDTSTGWALYYDHANSVTAEDHVFGVNWMDERTSSTTGDRGRIITWNTLQPASDTVSTGTATGGCRTSRCTAVDRRVTYKYGADVVTGEPMLKDPATGAIVRSFKGVMLVPPQGDQTTVFVNQKGQVAVGLTSVSPEKGATNVAMSEPQDPTTDAGWVEVSKELHACRHASALTPPDPAVCK